MGKTIADELKEEGAVAALQRTLIKQLGERFGRLSEGVAATIQSTHDVGKLDLWLAQVVSASSFDELNIESSE